MAKKQPEEEPKFVVRKLGFSLWGVLNTDTQQIVSFWTLESVASAEAKRLNPQEKEKQDGLPNGN